MQFTYTFILGLIVLTAIAAGIGALVTSIVLRARVKSNEASGAHRLEVLEQECARATARHRETLARLSETTQELSTLKHEKHALDISHGKFEQQLSDLKNEFTRRQDKIESLEKKNTQLITDHTRLSVSLSEREQANQRLLAQFEEQKAALEKQFSELASNILENKSKALQNTTHLGMTTLLSPFEKTLVDFKKEVKEIHHRETVQSAELKQELLELKLLNQKITQEAHQLSTALQGQKKLQGNWGELVLENVLDRSGLQRDKDYKREVSFDTEAGRQRPDVIIYLPQEKHLVIDAKVSLSAYTRFVNETDEALKTQALQEHVGAFSARIQELADRDYHRLPGINSPEIVFMFVPIESAFVEALKADETLFQRAIENNVLVATPTTLLTSLNIVRQLWRFEDQNKHTVALASKAEAVFKKLNSFLKSFAEVKKGLDRASEHYNAAESQLLSGRGNLVKQVNDFKSLAPAIRQELPAYFTDKAHLEIDLVAQHKGECGEVELQSTP